MNKKRCVNCMREIGVNVSLCPHCGYGQGEGQFPFGIREGTILRGRYLTGRMLGQGGFGITYIGYDLTLDVRVAIKEYFPSGSVTRNNMVSNQVQWNAAQLNREQWQAGCESFLKEARRMAKIDSLPGIVRVRDTFPENQTAYIVMDYIEGETLKQRLQKTGPMGFTQCVERLWPLMKSLGRMHSQGLIHRDISPDNIMVQTDGSVCLLDFGAAKDISLHQTMSSQQVAKRGFSPPEQYREKGSIGPWTDVYALCATIYYCVTGRLVPDAMERLYEDTVVFDMPLAEPLGEAAVSALKEGLKLRSEERIQTVEDLLRRLKGADAGRQPAAQDGSPSRAAAQDGSPTQPMTQDGSPAQPVAQDGSPAQPVAQDGSLTRPASQPQYASTAAAGTPQGGPEKGKISVKAVGIAAAAVVAVFFITLAGIGAFSHKEPEQRAEVEQQVQQPAAQEEAVEEAAREVLSEAASSGKTASRPKPQLSSPPTFDEDGQAASNVLIRDDSGGWGEDKIYQGTVLGSQIARGSIASVTFLDTLDGAPEEAFDRNADEKDMVGMSWDVSQEQNGTVLAWIAQSNAGDDVYDLYIGAEGGVKGQDCTELFAGYISVQEIDFNGCFDTSQVTSMRGMFLQCFNLTQLDVGGLDTSQVTDMAWMFSFCTLMEGLDLRNADTGNVTDMSYMFAGCVSLVQLAVDGFDTGSVTDMSYMFAYCSGLTGLDASGFDLGSLEDWEGMFAESAVTARQAGLALSGEYVLPDSDSRYLVESDMEGLSKEECRIARNEIFARHGRRFDDEELQAYFDSCSWYIGTVAPEDFDDSVLNQYEVANRDFIVKYEQEMGYR